MSHDPLTLEPRMDSSPSGNIRGRSGTMNNGIIVDRKKERKWMKENGLAYREDTDNRKQLRKIGKEYRRMVELKVPKHVIDRELSRETARYARGNNG